MAARQRILLASNNPGKLHECQQYLADLNIELVAQSSLSIPEAIESGLSFVENAIIKARHAAQHTDLPVLADDSGLAVDALHGQPGIHSARFAGNNASDSDNNHKLLQQLADVPTNQRSAYFYCVLVYMRHRNDPIPLIAEGRWTGQILTAPRGSNGFGYDPLFFVPNSGCSAAELEPAVKNRISHRGQALTRLAAQLA